MSRLAKILLLLAVLGTANEVSAQRVLGDKLENERVESIPFGHMDQWVTRRIKESAIIGGNRRDVFAIGPTETIEGDEPYVSKGGSPWATSNVMAKVAGVTKTNTSVFPERRGEGFAARMDTRMESVRVLGLIDITVLAAGSTFLGKVHEPIKSTKNPHKMLQSGIPFNQKPRAIRFDYKVKLSGEPNRIRSTGFGKTKTIPGKDLPIMVCLLQKRWEDAKGNVYAKRVGTMVVYFYEDTDWVNQATYEILYGDIRTNRYYLEDRMHLQDEERFTVNSKGESVPIQEIEWGSESDEPTHLILQFASSHGGAYIGSPGNKFWIDNVKLVF